jgi:hypothetical protein
MSGNFVQCICTVQNACHPCDWSSVGQMSSTIFNYFWRTFFKFSLKMFTFENIDNWTYIKVCIMEIMGVLVTHL